MHAQDRAAERYNKNFTPKDIAEIGRLIFYGKYIHAGRVSEDEFFAYVIYENLPIKVLYRRNDKKPKIKIITLYPIDVEEYNYLISKKAEEDAIQFLQSKGFLVIKLGG